MKRSLYMKPLLFMLSAILMALTLITPASATTEKSYLLKMHIVDHVSIPVIKSKGLSLTASEVSGLSENKYKFNSDSTYKYSFVKKVSLPDYNRTQKVSTYVNRMRYAHNRKRAYDRYSQLKHSSLYG